MKAIILIALTAVVSAEDPMDNKTKIWKNDWELYRSYRDDADQNDCRIPESKNWSGAQQCKFSWECRGARTCERGGWCNGYDGCDGTIFPMQAPGLLPDC